jgi:hypothetical protein
MFHCVTIRQPKDLMDCKPGGTFPPHPHAEIALIIIESGYFLPEEIGHVSGNKGTVPVLASIHKDAFFLGMCMQVDKKETIFELGNLPLSMVYLWAAELTLAVPDPI